MLPDRGHIVLAPMDGLTDPVMRHVLTQIAHYDWCVSEFIRVSGQLLPKRVFYAYSPELNNGGKTASGTPVHIQFLGSDAIAIADNAARAVTLGAPAIDLNFGCPAKNVNKHRGGAVLLDEPETLHHIVSTVRRTVPAHIPVSAKMRLGYLDEAHTRDNALAIAEAGAAWLTIHARTKADGYTPPAYWHKIAPLTQYIRIPIIANGELWSVSDAVQCQQESLCKHLMLGRGAVARPDLARQLVGASSLPWPALLRWHLDFLNGETTVDYGMVGRYKQWIGLLTQGYPEATTLWQHIKRLKQLSDIQAIVERMAEAASVL